MMQIFGAVAQFERALIRERQKEGQIAARAKGKVPGRKPKLSEVQQEELHSRIAANEPKAQVARDFGISRETLYSYLKN